jgi:hypothetical protein
MPSWAEYPGPRTGRADTATSADTATTLTNLTAAVGEINQNCDVSGRLVTLDATSLSASPGVHGDRVILFSHTAATSTVTLPVATGTGNIYTFIVAVANTNNHVIQVGDATDEFVGSIYQIDVDDDSFNVYPALAADDFDTITLNGTTTGGLTGDWIQIIDAGSNTWVVRGFTAASGASTTPFTSVVV